MRSPILLGLFLAQLSDSQNNGTEHPLYTPGTGDHYVVHTNGRVLTQENDHEQYFLGKTASYRKVNNKPFNGLLLEEGNGLFEISEGKISDEPIDFVKEMENKTCIDFKDGDGISPLDVVREGDGSEPVYQPISEAMNQYYPSCYIGDTTGRYFDVAVVTDVALYQKLGQSIEKVKAFVEDTIVKARLVYYRQFNIVLRIHSLRIFTDDYTNTERGFPLSMSTTSCVFDHSFVVQMLRTWNGANTAAGKVAAATHMFTGCWGPVGVVGIAYINNLCFTSSVGITAQLSSTSTWLIFSHELGHNLGAEHTFHLGIGRTGGLMDYGNPYYNGDIQFRPESAVQMCAGLNSAMSRGTCGSFATLSSRCGDLILEQYKEEECECLDGSTSCKGCRNCKLLDRGTECSTQDFVIPSPTNNASMITVLPSLLHNDQCCSSNGRIRSSLTRCGPEDKDTCSNGNCVKLCSVYGYWSCDMEEDGCVQPCKTAPTSTQCYAGWVTMTLKTNISHMPNGTWCGDKGIGRCLSGKCVYSDADLPTVRPTYHPTDSPTLMPTSEDDQKQETPAPTERVPTRFPTPKKTRRPTLGGTRFPTRFRRTRQPTIQQGYNETTGETIHPKLPYPICRSNRINKHCLRYKRRLSCNSDPLCRFRKYDMVCRASCRNQTGTLPPEY